MAVVGFIGLGVMGRSMAVNLVKAGHEVVAHDVRREAVADLAAQGAKPAASVEEAAARADIVVTMLPDTPQVEEVVLAAGGLAENPPPGRLLVDMSTIAPSAARRLAEAMAERGVAMLDAPVSGGPQGAENGTLSIMVGGEAEAVARARPVLEGMGRTIVHVGPAGAGQTVKCCNQLMVGLHIQAVCEALALGRAAGLDLVKLREVLLGGAAASWMLQNHAPLILAKDDRAGFRIDLQLKDLRLANELASELGVPLPGTAQVTSLYLGSRAHGEADKGNQALFRVDDRMTAQEGGGTHRPNPALSFELSRNASEPRDGVLQLPLRGDEGRAGGCGEPEDHGGRDEARVQESRAPHRRGDRPHGACAARPRQERQRGREGGLRHRPGAAQERRRLLRREELRGARRRDREEPRLRGEDGLRRRPLYFAASSFSAARLVKRALPRPVPMVSTPQRATSCIAGTSERPCTTASLCMTTMVSCPPISGTARRSSAGRLNRLLSQLPGRFWPPRWMAPSSPMSPGQPMPMKGATLCSALSARSTRSLTIAARRPTASARDGGGSSSRWRQRSNFQTSAFERSG